MLSPIEHSAAFANSSLEVAHEAVKERVSDKEDEPERCYGNCIVPEVVVGVPVGAQFVEPLIFNTPAFMPEEDYVFCADFAGR